MGLLDAWLSPSSLNRYVRIWVLSLLLLIAAIKAEIRCYCNQPACIPTGYMCKSSSGSCFTEFFSYSDDLSKSRHGCVELLSAQKRAHCLAPTAEVTNLPVVFCCEDDMCNYNMNTMDIHINVHGKPNRSQVAGPYDPTEERKAYEAALQQDLWFKAAVIAVPIAGGFILILLILLATRMLRQDSKRQRQLLELRRQQTLFNKSHIFFGQPCLNHPNCSGSNSARSPKASSHLHGATNLSLSRDSWCMDAGTAERQYVFDKPSSSRNSMTASLIPWTKWGPTKTASSTHV